MPSAQRNKIVEESSQFLEAIWKKSNINELLQEFNESQFEISHDNRDEANDSVMRKFDYDGIM